MATVRNKAWERNNQLEPEHIKCMLRGVTSTETERSHKMSQSTPWQSREGRPEDRLRQTDNLCTDFDWVTCYYIGSLRVVWKVLGAGFTTIFSLCVKWGHLIASPNFPGLSRFPDAVQKCETSTEHENSEIRQELIWFLFRYRPVWASYIIWNF